MGLFSNLTGGGHGTGNTSVEYEMKRATRNGWRDVIFCIVMVVIILMFFQGNRTVSPVIEEETFAVTGLEETGIQFRYEELDSIEMRKGLADFDLGEKIEGSELRKCICGKYKNSEFGEYQLYIVTNVTRYLVLELNDGTTVVFNADNEETTEAMYNFLTEKSMYAKEGE